MFPAELPPCFSTSSFAGLVATQYASLPKVFTSASLRTKLLKHSFTRVGIYRRPLGIPNPLSFVLLAKEVADSWADISAHTQQSPYSLSIPVASGKRAIKPKHDMSDPLERRLKIRTGARFCLRVDISQCYPSLYTHSIPWALHTKNVAKARRKDNSLLGNRLDLQVRRCQDAQTIGVPIGPDTSLVISEIILTAIDTELAKSVGPRGLRFIDDYEFCFSTFADADRALSRIQNLLEDYELRVNPRKTQIFELPAALDTEWASEIRLLPVARNAKTQRFQLTRIFDRAAVLSKEYTSETVLKYTVAKIRNARVAPANRSFVESLLLQILAADPSVIAEVLQTLIRLAAAGHKLDTQQLGEALNSIVEAHAPQRHDNEVAWALWACIRFQTKLTREAVDALRECKSAVVGILALDAQKNGLADGLDTTWYQSLMDDQELRDQNWLLSYEANVHGWLKSNSPKDHVTQDPGFAFLKTKGVRFYRPVTRTSAIPSKSVTFKKKKAKLLPPSMATSIP
ncbi:MAG: RNA-directed DNA polymerase [Terriglobales bacterium]|jgi:hypothetical protein